jgi:zinc and cadmium transporter
LFLLERFYAYHHHESPAGSSEPGAAHDHDHPQEHGRSGGSTDEGASTGGAIPAKGTSLHWGAAAFGLAVHSVVGGIALASAATAGEELRGGPGTAAWGVFVATLVHKPADALTIVSLMLRAGASRGLAHLVNLAFALMIPLGVLLFTLGAGQLRPASAAGLSAAALAFSAGTFLCIALSDLLPELQFHAHDRLVLSAALLTGLLLMAASSAWESTEVPPAAPALIPRALTH